MKVYAINGSPRKKRNTAILLEKALEGAASRGAETEMIHLYDYKYTGCKSCFACKLTGGKNYGKCALRDDLTPLLDKLSAADGIILGTPIYYHSVSGQMQSFIERLLYPYYVYDGKNTSIAPKKMPAAIIYTMNVTDDAKDFWNYEWELERIHYYVGAIFDGCDAMYCTDTFQFDDYSKYMAPFYSQEEKQKVKETVFPLDCSKAYGLGVRLTEGGMEKWEESRFGSIAE